MRARALETTREQESERLGIVMLSMWHALTPLQREADENGFGHYWARMLSARTQQAATYAETAARMAGADQLEAVVFNASGALANVTTAAHPKAPQMLKEPAGVQPPARVSLPGPRSRCIATPGARCPVPGARCQVSCQ
ncbi:hypothetical protein ACWPKO_29905 (plasmid) [Coraliomargarita sp. W4R53]